MSAVTIILGRDGMDDGASDADFDAWVAYVAERIDARSGCDVTVEERAPRDVQSTGYVGERDPRDSARTADAVDSVRDAVGALWEEFCADASAGPAREAGAS